jgi:hypothetical protein
MNLARLSETLVSHQNTTVHHNPEDLVLNVHRPGNIKSRFTLLQLTLSS